MHSLYLELCLSAVTAAGPRPHLPAAALTTAVIDMQLAQPGCHVQHDVAEFAQFWAAAPEISHMNGRPGF